MRRRVEIDGYLVFGNTLILLLNINLAFKSSRSMPENASRLFL